jgi:hypothetical protein
VFRPFGQAGQNRIFSPIELKPFGSYRFRRPEAGMLESLEDQKLHALLASQHSGFPANRAIINSNKK